MKRAVFGIGEVLVVLAVLSVIATTPTLAHVDVYFSPDPSTISLEPGENVTIQVIADLDANETDGFRAYQVGIDFDPDIVNITKIENFVILTMSGSKSMPTWYVLNPSVSFASTSAMT